MIKLFILTLAAAALGAPRPQEALYEDNMFTKVDVDILSMIDTAGKETFEAGYLVQEIIMNFIFCSCRRNGPCFVS